MFLPVRISCRIITIINMSLEREGLVSRGISGREIHLCDVFERYLALLFALPFMAIIYHRKMTFARWKIVQSE